MGTAGGQCMCGVPMSDVRHRHQRRNHECIHHNHDDCKACRAFVAHGIERLQSWLDKIGDLYD